MPEPVVFLHAFPLPAEMWAAQVATLRDVEKVLAPDLPGFGGRPLAEPSLDAFADAVLADMDAAGLDRAVLVGLSMGGYVALRLAERARERVAGLVLADTRAAGDDDAGRARRTEQAERVRDEGTGWMAEVLVPNLLGDTTRAQRPEVVARVREWVASANPEGVARALLAMRDRPDSTALLPTLELPALVLVGEEDTLTPLPLAQDMANALPQGRLALVPEAGHLSNLENPLAFDAHLTRFLTSLD